MNKIISYEQKIRILNKINEQVIYYARRNFMDGLFANIQSANIQKWKRSAQSWKNWIQIKSDVVKIFKMDK